MKLLLVKGGMKGKFCTSITTYNYVNLIRYVLRKVLRLPVIVVIEFLQVVDYEENGSVYENRTHLSALRGLCPNR